MAKNSEGKYFYVINYFPTGNIDGEFKKNVLPLGTKVALDLNSKQNKKEEISKNDMSDSDEDDMKKNSKYTIKKVVKEYNDIDDDDDDFDKEFEDFKKGFGKFDMNNADNKVEVHVTKKEINDKKDINNRKNILSELIKNKKKQITKENKYTNDNVNSISNSDFNTFCLQALECHNKYRKMHHAPPLKLNKEICTIAENYAKTLATKLKCLQHSENTYKGQELGENLFGCFGMEATGQEISDHWYSEIKKYNFNGDWQGGCGHFTQMVWKDTEEVGFGKWKDKSGQIYVVANYYPAGNFLGCFKENVLRK
jgi:uncharacterized protein YkwD